MVCLGDAKCEVGMGVGRDGIMLGVVGYDWAISGEMKLTGLVHPDHEKIP